MVKINCKDVIVVPYFIRENAHPLYGDTLKDEFVRFLEKRDYDMAQVRLVQIGKHALAADSQEDMDEALRAQNLLNAFSNRKFNLADCLVE